MMTDETGIEFTQTEHDKLLNFFTNSNSTFVSTIKTRILTLVSNRVKKERRVAIAGNFKYRCFNGLMQGANVSMDNWRNLDGINPNDPMLIAAIAEIQAKGEFLTDEEIAAKSLG